MTGSESCSILLVPVWTIAVGEVIQVNKVIAW